MVIQTQVISTAFNEMVIPRPVPGLGMRQSWISSGERLVPCFRPLEITTQEFGKKWSSFSYEKKLKISSSLKKPAEFMEAMEKLFNFYPIQVIGTLCCWRCPLSCVRSPLTFPSGNEAIAAGTFLPAVTCLAHGKMASTQLEFWVRTPSSLLTESIAKMAQALLKWFLNFFTLVCVWCADHELFLVL